jgi:two-component system response regulator ArlR
MMELFMRHPRVVFSTDRLMEKIWGLDAEADIDVVWTYIGFLRRKLRGLDADVEIRTIRGAGYSLEEDTEDLTNR